MSSLYGPLQRDLMCDAIHVLFSQGEYTGQRSINSVELAMDESGLWHHSIAYIYVNEVRRFTTLLHSIYSPRLYPSLNIS